MRHTQFERDLKYKSSARQAITHIAETDPESFIEDEPEPIDDSLAIVDIEGPFKIERGSI